MNNDQRIIGFGDVEPLCKRLRLGAMLIRLRDSLNDPSMLEQSHLEWFYDLLFAEVTKREENSLRRRLKEATIRHTDACMANIDFKSPRGLNKAQIMALGSCDWIRNHQNCIITGMTGTGKTWLAGALANAACRQGMTVRFVRVPRFLKRFNAQQCLDRGFERELRELRGIDLLVLDDWGIGQMNSANRSDLLEIIEDRVGIGSTMVTSVIPVKEWSGFIDDPTFADSILDRLVRNAHRINIIGESMRKQEQYGAVMSANAG